MHHQPTNIFPGKKKATEFSAHTDNNICTDFRNTKCGGKYILESGNAVCFLLTCFKVLGDKSISGT